MNNNSQPDYLTQIFDEPGLISDKLPHYEFREQQLQMAQAIQKSINTQSHLIIEAGTGIGKSLAYLVPMIYWAAGQKKKVVISTCTKTLQEQLVNKDLPFLQEILPVNFSYILCLGTENYLCLRRLSQIRQYGLFENIDEVQQVNKIFEWAEETDTGIKLELPFEPHNRIWYQVCRTSDLCMGNNCKFRNNCFFAKAKERQYNSDILVVNHHLFFTNIKSGGKILPHYDALLFDEAHNVEDIATEYLGLEVTNSGIEYILGHIYSYKNDRGLLSRIAGMKKTTKNLISNAIKTVSDTAVKFFTNILDELGSEPKTKRINIENFVDNILEEPIMTLYNCMQQGITEIPDTGEDLRLELHAYAERVLSINTGIKTFLEHKQKDYVYWIEINQQIKSVRVGLRNAPIDISGLLNETVFSRTTPVILTSATLAINNSFEYIKERIGLKTANELLLGSPFNYRKQMLLLLNTDLPDPSAKPKEFAEGAVINTAKLVEITQGRTFILFTSYDTLEKTYLHLKKAVPTVKLMKQGEFPRWQMIKKFMKNRNAVLLGTSTFWQGVDIPGKALECVIIFKLPFAVPDTPVTEAKIEFLRMQGKDPFTHYQLPQSIIMLKQGVGRLIRAKTDRGVVSILDPRITTRFYGKLFIDSLPECNITTNIDDVTDFFNF